MKLMATEKAILAGGCFWGMEELIRDLPGVLSTVVGYTGGDVKNATYLADCFLEDRNACCDLVYRARADHSSKRELLAIGVKLCLEGYGETR